MKDKDDKKLKKESKSNNCIKNISKQENKKGILKKTTKEKTEKNTTIYKKVYKGPDFRVIIGLCILIFGFVIGAYFYTNRTQPALALKEYFKNLENKNYDAMYDLVKADLPKEEFIARVKNIYEGIEASNILITVAANTSSEGSNKDTNITYTNSMNTLAGSTTFTNTAKMLYIDGKYKIDWNSNVIFPGLDDDEKVRVITITPNRGSIYDRNDVVIAKEGTCYSVGLVPGKMNETTDISKISELLEISQDTINSSLNASYVKSDTFVPLKKISKDEQDLKKSLLQIKGIMITDSKVRVYPYKKATSILTGYVQSGDGKSGLEYIFNDTLKGTDGKEIYIEKDDKKIKTLVKKEVKDGLNIKLTIDVQKQQSIYDEFKDDQGASVAVNYKTGEILALVSTPSYDANDFSLGITDTEWNDLQNDKNYPMYNRYLGAYAPGSSIKPLIGAIGLMYNCFTADEDFGISGTRWQKDKSWGDLFVTTLEKYSGPANLENALVYSDNIYFAKAALKIGKSNLITGLENLGFDNKIDFEQDITKSTYGSLDSDASIANSGYGQSEMLVNPIHMASIYSIFANNGNMIKPYIEFSKGETKTYKENAINSDIANEIKEDLSQVVKTGTATDCNIDGKNIYGKTGTAEIKQSQSDENGTEIGWFDAFDDDGFLIVSMVQNVKDIGGSHYVVKKVRNIF